MFRKLLTTSLLLASTTFSSSALAHDSFFNDHYVRFDLGYAKSLKAAGEGRNNYNNKLKQSSIFSLGFGTFLDENVRADINFSYRPGFKFTQYLEGDGLKASYSQKMKVYTAMANVYYDIPVEYSVKPYLTAGLGYSRISLGKFFTDNHGQTPNTAHDGGHSNNFAWQLGAGAAVNVAENTDVDFSYRFSDLGRLNSTKSSDNSTLKGKLRAHEFMVGLRYKF